MPRSPRLPHWPRRMQARLAAAYCGVSRAEFLADVKAGKYPPATKDGHNALWYIEDLDAALDRLRGGTGTREGQDLERAWASIRAVAGRQKRERAAHRKKKLSEAGLRLMARLLVFKTLT